jgi:FHS family glucose/mannose:H+ symporter-like MFS transporter
MTTQRNHARMLSVPTNRILIFGFLAFILIGLEQGVLGLFVAELGQHFNRSPKDLGLFFALHGIGSGLVTAVALVSWVERRNSKRIALSSLALGLGSGLIVVGDSWHLKLIAAPLLGIGFGGLSMSFNTLFVTYFSQKNASLLNVLNATYGIGAVAAPWLLSRDLLAGSELFNVIALLSFIVLVGAWTIDDRIPSHTHTDTTSSTTTSVYPILLVAFLILFIEAALTYWMPSLLSAQSSNNADAADYMAQFFLWFVIVRLSAAALAVWVSTLGFALLGLLGLCLSLAGVVTGFVALADTSFTGAFMGLIFPNAYAWMLTKSGGGTAMGARILLSAIVGATTGPWILGWILPLAGETAVLVLLSAVSAATFLLMLFLDLKTRRLPQNVTRKDV